MLSRTANILNTAKYRYFTTSVRVGFGFTITNMARKTNPIDLTADLGDKTKDRVKTLEPRLVKNFVGDSIYDPFDFSMERIILDRKNRSSSRPLGKVNPLDLYQSPEILVKYVSSTGKILHRDVTGLTAKDQRRLSKAIRRCQAIGLMSKTSNEYNK